MISSTNPAIQQALEAGRLAAERVTQASKAGQPRGEKDFGTMLTDMVKDVNDAQNKSEEMQDDYLTGRKPTDVHDVMISMEKASTSLQLAMSVRNKALEAYQEINRMQV